MSTPPENFREQNAAAYDQMARDAHPLCKPCSDAELADPMRTIDPVGWLGESIHGKRVLCLAAGGGRHSVLYAAAGAEVTIVDISGQMLAIDREMVRRHDLRRVRLIQSGMDDLSRLRDAEFEIVVQPVSTCYVPDVASTYRQVARVCCPGGVYISQHKTPMNQQTTTVPSGGHYIVRHHWDRREPLPATRQRDPATRRLREPGATEYVHSYAALIGGLCRAGFHIADLTEPDHRKPKAETGSFADRAAFIPPYVRIKAIRNDAPAATSGLWTPD